MQCLVPPLVFTGLVVSMADMTLGNQAANIGGKTLILYLLTTAVATSIGLCMALLFRNAFDATPFPANETAVAVSIECGDRPGYYLSWSTNGTVRCEFYGSLDSSGGFNYDVIHDKPTLFLERDLNGTYERADDTYQDLTLTEALMTQLDALVPRNITQALAEGNLLSIITFAVLFGMVLSRNKLKTATEVVRDLNVAFIVLIGWVIKCTPVAICSLLVGAIANSQDLITLIKGVAVYCACDICGQVLHVFVFYPILMRFFVNTNPYQWMSKMIQAQLFAMGCASSAATLPVVMECIAATNVIPQEIYRFTLSLGATIGMDGTAVGTPIAIVFMAQVSDVDIDPVKYLVLWMVSAISAVGVGPVPSASIVMIMTVWRTVFPGEDLPPAFAFIPATDWFLDRLHTPVNVTCDAVVCRIVTEQVSGAKQDTTDARNPTADEAV
ncbi:Dicarboxylate/amino acid:cation (Na or H) symporter (DAACS) family protein [Phytophthora palmivora]|uniref:Amino acid transporter n=1 Tax=Phytophthora palmivora TaxID=4796 RepID=A0A2P4X156_9STRA|nr:Dicarboxylate/amino acid:cation (Na or H) symporter (DAACS) family protein [Phytophthora palmivora]